MIKNTYDELIHNGYLALLDEDTIVINHPFDEKQQIKLYRIIAIRAFKILEHDIVIRNGTIGGFVESLDNIDSDTYNWLDHRARVFGKAKISHGTYMTESSAVFDNADVRGSRLKNYSRVYNDAVVIDSQLNDLVEVRDNSSLINCKMYNSSMTFKNANLNDCTMKMGSSVRGDAILVNCQLNDTCQVGGTAKLVSCELFNDARVFDGEHRDESFDDEQILHSEVFGGELTDLVSVRFEFNLVTYNGFIFASPGKKRSLVYADQNGGTLLKTKNGMHLTVTAMELYGTEYFGDKSE